MRTTNNGTVCYDADFDPFGGERAYINNCPSTNVYTFEGKERDTETGNDDFGARYYSNRFGRWLSADWSAVPAPVPYANFTNPQTLNLYSMVSDDPESFADLDGHELEKAWKDFKIFLKSLSIKNTVGLGLEGHSELGRFETKAGFAAKVSMEVSPDSFTLSQSASVGVEGGLKGVKGAKIGESISIEKTVMTIKDGQVTGEEKDAKITRTDTLGLFGGNIETSDDKVGVGIELPVDPETLVVGGVDLETTGKGLNALKGTVKELKDTFDSLFPLPPPPLPPPPPRRCSSSGGKKC